MKSLTLLFFLILNFTYGSDLDSYKLSPELVKKLIGKNLANEILLKERLQRIDPNIIRGHIEGHKVGNGFGFFKPVPLKDEFLTCSVDGSSHLELIFFEDDAFNTFSVFTQNREEKSIAEFLNVNRIERSVGFKSYQFYTGTNPLNGQMFQLEFLPENKAILRIVYNERLSHFPMTCFRTW